MATAANTSDEVEGRNLYPVPVYYEDEAGPDSDHDNRPRYPSPRNDRGRSATRRVRAARGSWRGRGRNADENVTGDNSSGRSDRSRGQVSAGRRGSRNTRRGYRGRSNERHMENQSEQNLQIDTTDYSDNKQTTTDRPPNAVKYHRPILGYKRLEEMAERTDDPDSLLLEIATTKSGFEECLKRQDLNPDWLYLILKIMSTVTKSVNYQNLREVLQLVDTQLLSKITETFSDINTHSPKTSRYCKDASKLASLCLFTIYLLKTQMTVLSASLGKCNLVIMSLQTVVNMYQLGSVNEVLAGELAELDAIRQGVIEERQKIAESMTRPCGEKSKKHALCNDEPPPDNFREIQIFPDLKDLQWNDKPFLRVNKAKGKYDSLDNYLDIHFRLLREDYIQPLRQGIKDYRSAIQAGHDVKKLRNLRLYHDAQILRPVCASLGIDHIIQFDVTPLKGVNWQVSRRLLYGSLVCLTQDNFETNLFATVTEHKASKLAEGEVQVRFENVTVSNINPNDKFVMAETTAYFEAYRHILHRLQKIDNTLPFQKYILDCSPVLKPPRYLLGNPTYDFGCLQSRATLEKGARTAAVLTTTRWPGETDLSLDEHQLEAVKLAITKELAIIQGPPGTGKTYVGLQITKLLMANKKHWIENSKTGRSPILVVCYTNHALDQFLEGLLSAGIDGIVRVGGRCISEALEPYTLAELKKRKREERTRSWIVHEGEKECKRTLWECHEEIDTVSSKLNATTTRLIQYRDLEQFMTEKQRLSFHKHYRETVRLDNWLAIESGDVHDTESDNTVRKYKDEWKEYILKRATPMAEERAKCISKLMEVHPRERANLYKLWFVECTNTLKFSVSSQRVQHNTVTREKTDQLISSILNDNTHVTDAATLAKYVITDVYRKQILQLCQQKESLEKWLFLDESRESTEFIKCFMAEDVEIDNDTIETDNYDLEEAREVADDDNNEFLIEFKGKPTTDMSKSQTPDEENWKVQIKKHMMKSEVKRILSQSLQMTDQEEADQICDVCKIPVNIRNALYCFWLAQYKLYLKDIVRNAVDEYKSTTERYREILDQEVYEIMNTADLIGMTTTGSAKHGKILNKLGSKIIIVEEAAEVLESHIITTLNERCQHLILIGDHKQLRPSPAVYELSKKYNLDISFFERMVNNGIPCVQLTHQHRMRPDISALLRHKNLYPHLRDHETVLIYGNVLGINGNVLFINHEEHEQTRKESTSYSNSHEAKYLAALCGYIIKQGYMSQQITVITPYMGQVITLRQEMPKTEYEGVRITAVDNFQGEENDIILLSLVRSSCSDSTSGKKNRIGFLGIENRVCVALSRAKKGLYVIGNFKLLAKESELWKFMVDTMRGKSAVSEYIELYCQNHPQEKTKAYTAKDFESAPEGGCKKACEYRLQCGHFCPKYCHVLDREHKHSKCWKPCTRKCEANKHPCQKKCWQDCGKCETKMAKIIPMCRHSATMPCYFDPHLWDCKASCEFILKCGHKCGRKCSQCVKSHTHQDKCKVVCERQWPCGHSVESPCNEGPDRVPCPEPCQVTLDCGHKCRGACSKCLSGRVHIVCQGSCTKTLYCGHRCRYACSELCPPCNMPCEYTCSHSRRCNMKCSEKCEECTELCKYKCQHKSCNKLCYEVCDDSACDMPCLKKSKSCEHPCIGLCGETCLPYCCACQTEKTGKELDTNSRYISLIDCQCLIDVTRMDNHMKECVRLGSRTEWFYRCPECRKPIRSNRRYHSLIKEKQNDMVNKILKMHGSDQERHKEQTLIHVSIDKLAVNNVLHDWERNSLKSELTKNADKHGMLAYFRKIVENLEHVLKLNERLAVAKSDSSTSQEHTIVEKDIGLIKKVLLTRRRHGTRQLWKEIDMEIKRLRQILNGYVGTYV